ncbi:Isoflavone-7-O-methyltransferase 6 [Spatholobus suberectus]|nr:Isoflavone-7-O-methyltransferase 6 [Spatholobus suberectus]
MANANLMRSYSVLISDTDHCLSSMIKLLNNPYLVGSYHQLGKWASRENYPIIEIALGLKGHWDFIHQNLTYMRTFNEAMESDSLVVRLALTLRDSKFVF